MTVFRSWLLAAGPLVLGCAGCEDRELTGSVRIPDSSMPVLVHDASADANRDASAAPVFSETPCPEGYACRQLPVEGTDQDGHPVTGGSCSKGGLTTCDDADPVASCPDLDDPICVHLTFGGGPLVTCGQRCPQ